jgi:hypothetical protein
MRYEASPVWSAKASDRTEAKLLAQVNDQAQYVILLKQRDYVLFVFGPCAHCSEWITSNPKVTPKGYQLIRPLRGLSLPRLQTAAKSKVCQEPESAFYIGVILEVETKQDGS